MKKYRHLRIYLSTYRKIHSIAKKRKRSIIITLDDIMVDLAKRDQEKINSIFVDK